MAIRAIYTEVAADGRTPVFALSPGDHEKIRQGYGCPNCLEDFTEYGAGALHVAFQECPVCGHVLDANNDFVIAPAHMTANEPVTTHDPVTGRRRF